MFLLKYFKTLLNRPTKQGVVELFLITLFIVGITAVSEYKKYLNGMQW
jgi:hypothetical protein